jgi:probable rRNA maturation factor
VAVEVFGADEQSAVHVDLGELVALAKSALEAQGVPASSEVSLFFVDEDAIAELNERFLDKKGPTDVLSFPLEDEPLRSGRFPDSGSTGPGFEHSDEGPVVLLGDVVICPSMAQRNARDHELAEELALLVVHGVLHLLGWDHQTSSEAEKMEAREQELLARFAEGGPST